LTYILNWVLLNSLLVCFSALKKEARCEFHSCITLGAEGAATELTGSVASAKLAYFTSNPELFDPQWYLLVLAK